MLDSPSACYLADCPVDQLSFAAAVSQVDARSALADLNSRLAQVALDPRDRPAENRFVGGWAGFWGYEFGAALELVRPARVSDIPLPSARLALYDAVAYHNRADSSWQLSGLLLDSEKSTRDRLDRLEARLRDATAYGKLQQPTAEAGSGSGSPSQHWQTSAKASMTRADYESAVRRAKAYIAAGDIYQVNLAQRFTWPIAGGQATPGRLFDAMRRRHPADFAAFLAWPDQAGRPQALCSVSPELFVSVHAGRVRTSPIKGTRRRGGQSDAAAAAELLASEKDRAELAMIVDLERNDLGRVCRFGSVRVVEARRLQTLPHVFHTFATVEGQLADGRDIIDLLEAAFPGGSITGAPKIRAMQIIAELEPTIRSAYTGAVGYIGADGSAMLNIAIRTAIIAGGSIHLHVGAGIVADSQPDAEYDETLAKAEGLAQAICEARHADHLP